LSLPPFNVGDSVWCAFPEREHPARPSRNLHICYTLIVTAAGVVAPGLPPSYQAFVAYTTSRPPQHDGRQPGVVPFSAEEATELHLRRPFWLHLQRVAFLPVTPEWFPHLSAGGGVVASVTPTRRRELEAEATLVRRRHAADAVLGPSMPRPRG